MPKMQFGLSAFERARGDLPELPVINMFAEEAPTEETGIILQSRPGLETVTTLGAGPVDAIFQKDGALSGTRFAVSALGLYSGTSLVGSVNGAGPFSMDAFEDTLFIAGGGSLWSYDGTMLAAVSFPDSANVSKVVVGASRAICLRADTETYYWSDVLSTTVGALSFTSAESQPDRLRDILFIDDIAILFGAETVEFHPNTGDADLPFQPLEGRVFEKGVKATGCASAFGSTFAWVTNNNQVCISDPDNIISNPGLETLIEGSTSTRLWTFFLEGTEFLALTIDAGTWVFSERSKLWSEMASNGESNWIPQCYGGGVFGSSIDGKLAQWTSGHTDFNGVLERRFRAGFPLNSSGVSIDNIILRVNVGQTPYLSGDYTTPVVEMRRSLDSGQTWGNWRAVSLGSQGQYRKKVQWTGCGQAGQPGWLSEFRVTAPVPFRVSDALVNEPYGGI